MRSFYILSRDPSRHDLQSLIHSELAGFNPALLRRGERIDAFPTDMRLFVTNKNRTDSLGNAHGWHILSERAMMNVKELVPETDLQVLSLPILDSITKTPVEGYYLVNCLRVIGALGYQ